MQKALELASLINSQYKKLIAVLAAMLYDLNKANFPLEIISKDINKPKPTIMDEIRKAYIEDEIIQKIIQAKLNGF